MHAWRSNGCEHSLFVAAPPGLTVAASRPECIFANALVPKELDFEAAAAWAAQVPTIGSRSMYQSVRRVRPGQVLAVAPGVQPKEVARWRPRRIPQSFRSLREAGEELHATIGRAVADTIGERDQVGLLLSGGRDSSAVLAMASAHLAERGRALHAFTGAPALGVSARAMPGCVADEGEAAAETVARFPDVVHHICRPEPGSFLEILPKIHRTSLQPVGNLGNWPWYWACLEQARGSGVEVMLSGGMGNLTISTGSREFLTDIAAEQGIAAALRWLPSSAGRQGTAWLNAAHVLLRPHLPRRAVEAILRASGRDRHVSMEAPVIHPDLRAQAERDYADGWPDQSSLTAFGWRQAMLAEMDSAANLSAALVGFDERDPTRDPRVIQLILSMPPEYLLPRPDDPKPLFTEAFGRSLPRRVARSTIRGYQGADWDAQFPVADVESRFRTLFDHPLNQQLFDRNFILRAVPQRPTDVDALRTGSVIDLHRNQLLGALAVADWVAVNFPDG
ncbi:asparagine synthase C-terminal domain-containing protein [Sphingomonas sp. LHG3406-1]|uniref:asparagine synthase-related protein n=1 Tax=Sphingomonas sp. LHG3406-1 TaxID=2804617 RepID=UPI00263670DE|nr:asparagine synthase C-terminal domain-containing protein [Sphingomonas sp. LHG3406-1]